jgi:2-(1,2-epoxy-1,2-dihydrophenyl)acetyl-CoA isomerase
VPDAGLTYLLPRHLGSERALRAVLFAEPISAEDALAAGLVGEVTAPEHLLERAVATAERLAALPRLATRLTRQAMRHALDSGLESALAYEYQALVEANRDADVAEAVRAFVEKRPPRFR